MNVLRAALSDPRARVGAGILLVFALMAVFAPLLTHVQPGAQQFGRWLPPSLAHPLGTTSLGQDTYTQLVWGARLTLLVGLGTGLLVSAVATLIGLASAYFGGVVDDVLSVVTNVFLVLPGLPLILVVAAYVKLSGVLPIVAVIALTGWAWGARVLRSQALSLRGRDFVQAAVASGEGPLRVMLVHILPNMAGLIAANFFGAALYAVLAEAGLEFLGIGNVSVVTWGTMLYWAQSNQALLRDAWYWIAAPGVCIALLGTAFALLNFGVDAVSNPRLREGRGGKTGPVRRARRVPAPAAPPRPAGDALLQVRGLEAGYLTPGGPVRAVRGVDLDVRRGEFVGLAGESGCGKTTLAFAVARLLRPPGAALGGEAWLDGRDLLRLPDAELRAARWRDFSVVFQASMNVLNPVLRLRAQVYDALRAHGVKNRASYRPRAAELFRLVGLRPELLDAYPHQLSGGMKQRAVIAIALALEPKLVIMDEPTTALDVVVQRALLQEVDALRRRLNLSVVLITHDLSLLVEMSDRVAIMYAGEIVEEAPSRELYAAPLHPYTRSLMAAFPPLSGERERRGGIPGKPPALSETWSGCPFAPRCEHALPGLCDRRAPRRVEARPGHTVACHLHDPEVLEVNHAPRATISQALS